MRRRTLLQTGVCAIAAGLSGCLSTGGGSAGPGDGNRSTTPGTTTGEPTTDQPTTSEATTDRGTDEPTSNGPTLRDASFAITDAGCGTETNEATVTRDEATGSAVVEGTTTVPSACYTASLAGASYDAETDAARVDVVTERRPDADACAQCLTEIEYRVELSFEGGLPGTVAVTHDGETVCEAGKTDTAT